METTIKIIARDQPSFSTLKRYKSTHTTHKGDDESISTREVPLLPLLGGLSIVTRKPKALLG